MTGNGSNGRGAIGDADLHAYADHALDPVDYERVQAHLIDNPNDAVKVQAYAIQNLALRSNFDAGGESAADLRIAHLTVQFERRLRRQQRFRQAVRAGVASLTFVSVVWTGLVAFGVLRPGDRVEQDFVQQAAAAHRLFAFDADDVGRTGSPDEAAVVSWLSQRVAGVPMRAPDLSAAGYRLARERVVATPGNPAALLVYENRSGGDPLTLYIGKRTGARHASTIYSRQNDISMVYWQAGPLAYSLVGRIDRRTLLRLAGNADAQLRAQPPLPKRLVRQPPLPKPELTHTNPVRAEPAVVRPGEADSRDAVDETRRPADAAPSPDASPMESVTPVSQDAQPEKT